MYCLGSSEKQFVIPTRTYKNCTLPDKTNRRTNNIRALSLVAMGTCIYMYVHIKYFLKNDESAFQLPQDIRIVHA